MTLTDEIIQYPLVKHDDLSIDPGYRELQQQGAVKVQLAYGEPCWLATRYHDVKTVYGDRRFGKEIGAGRDTPRMWPNHIDDPTRLSDMDPPRHTRVRRLTFSAFSLPQIRDMRGWVEGLVDERLDALVAQGQPADFTSVVAWPLPLTVLSGILGVPESDIPAFRGWIDELVGVDTGPETRESAYKNLTDFIRGLVAERRVRGTDDLLSVLVHARDDEDQLTEDELISLSMTLFLGGFETTAAQLGSTVFALMSQRDLWEELQGDRSLIPAALEELWRWIPSFRHGMPMIRWANEDVELSDGVVVPAGQAVLPEHQIANRDESVFPHGWELDFHRVEPQPHLSLAFGAHRCLGAHLAHLEVEATLTGLLNRFPTLELAVAPEDVEWSPSTFLRSAVALPLKW